MPTATTYIDPTLVGAAAAYYSMFPVEPTKSGDASDWITVGKPVGLKTQRVEDLLGLIRKEVKSGGNVLTVGHGTDAGLHFHIGKPANGVFTQIQALTALRVNREGNQSDADTMKILKIDDAKEFGKLKSLIADVQNLNLDRVDARACNTGQNDGAMSELQMFFNCNIFCAPKMLDSFGYIGYRPLAKNGDDFNQWVAKHRNVRMKGVAPDRFALDQNYSGGIKLAAIAESPEAAKAWADAYLPGGGNFTGKNELFYHALTNLKQDMIFAGQPEFRALLVEAEKGKVPSRTIDLNKMPILPPP